MCTLTLKDCDISLNELLIENNDKLQSDPFNDKAIVEVVICIECS